MKSREKTNESLIFKNNEFNVNNINKRSNSSGANRNSIKFGGERLYEQYMKKLE